VNAHHGNRFQLRASFSAFPIDARAGLRAIQDGRERAGEEALRVVCGALGEGAGGGGDESIEAAVAARRVGLDRGEHRGGCRASGGVGRLAQRRGGSVARRGLCLRQPHGVARAGDGAAGFPAGGRGVARAERRQQGGAPSVGRRPRASSRRPAVDARRAATARSIAASASPTRRSFARSARSAAAIAASKPTSEASIASTILASSGGASASCIGIGRCGGSAAPGTRAGGDAPAARSCISTRPPS
jgi:hypothetical protein